MGVNPFMCQHLLRTTGAKPAPRANKAGDANASGHEAADNENKGLDERGDANATAAKRKTAKNKRR